MTLSAIQVHRIEKTMPTRCTTSSACCSALLTVTKRMLGRPTASQITYRTSVIRIIGAGYWSKGKAIYERENKIHDEPLGKVQVVPDFLPSPAELAFREEGVKVTLALSKKSIEFFKSEATKHHTQYQRMIRRLLDAYVDGQAPTRPSTRTLRDKAAQRR